MLGFIKKIVNMMKLELIQSQQLIEVVWVSYLLHYDKQRVNKWNETLLQKHLSCKKKELCYKILFIVYI